MLDATPCPEYISLRWEYEAALQLWGDLLLAQHGELADAYFKRAVELRKDAADERDAANKRMEDHKLSCSVCREGTRLFEISHRGSKPSKS
jgi:hypothetical protein